jgi:hypothetical protein
MFENFPEETHEKMKRFHAATGRNVILMASDKKGNTAFLPACDSSFCFETLFHLISNIATDITGEDDRSPASLKVSLEFIHEIRDMFATQKTASMNRFIQRYIDTMNAKKVAT